ncbi:hypothetical protein [Caldibacillus phage CBP1]|uniref:Uncharacterized protein n=1 Tax=Caldibacillus debilis GB1 TaxID=1339248 RepID=A0A420VIS1_9BACI|nr:hypothetical protein [Caldibacillus debilis]ATB52749.1 hypothetical protein [Caldibacillus phage CBP1]RKO63574.1 hypothetical protein Cdeb_02836 [Caldibacillus debilis GB1]
MYILNSNFTFLKNVGDISEVKLNELKEAFKNYPEFIYQGKNNLLFRKGVSGIVIQPNQLTYVTQGDVEQIDLEFIISELQKLHELLNLSQSSVFGLRFEAIENRNTNLMEKSRLIIKDVSDIIEAQGIGFRFMIKNEKFFGDIHIEPFIKDPQKSFFNVILQSSANINVNESHAFVRELFDWSLEKIKKAANELYK